MKKFYFLFLLFSFIAFGQEAYYTNGTNDVDFNLTGLALKSALSMKISNNVTYLPYTSGSYDTWDALKETDEDPNNSSNVLLFYNSGSVSKDNTLGNGNTGPEEWNREHVYAKSRAFPSLDTDDPGPGTDFNNLRACDPTINGNRGSLKFANGNGSFGITGGGWYPGDDWKGDVARIVMYMYLMYDGNGSSIAETHCLPSNIGIGNNAGAGDDMLDIFLDWNAADPVSSLELQRNSVSETQQGNRNPFIDNPALATVIWGGPTAEDRWGNLLSTNKQNPIELVSLLPNPLKGTLLTVETLINLKIEVYDVLGKKVHNQQVTKTNNTLQLNDLSKGVYLVKLISDQGEVTKKLIKQ